MSYKLRGFDIGFGQCDQKVTRFLDKVAKKGQNIYTKAWLWKGRNIHLQTPGFKIVYWSDNVKNWPSKK